MLTGFICLAGPPNVGKSTLLNRLVGRPISITADKPQTTRNRIMGVRTTAETQTIFVDTPGIHASQDKLNQRMVNYALAALEDTDAVFVLTVPFSKKRMAPSTEDKLVMERLSGTRQRALLVVNKIDLAQEHQVLETMRWFGDTGRFEEIVPISAFTGKGVDRLESLIPKYLGEGPQYFEADQVTDQSESMIVAELIRQEVFRRTHQEVPYATAVQVESMEQKDNRLVIHAKVWVERDSQKGIVIGKGGTMLKRIGQEARRRMESMLGMDIFLDLHVAVLKDWSSNPRHLTRLGYPES